MSEIKKLDADPTFALLLTLFAIQCGHYVINGQPRKWLVCLLGVLMGGVFCVLPGIFINVLSSIDAYQTADRLKKGETIGENEYSLPLLYNLVKLVDNEATCKTVAN